MSDKQPETVAELVRQTRVTIFGEKTKLYQYRDGQFLVFAMNDETTLCLGKAESEAVRAFLENEGEMTTNETQWKYGQPEKAGYYLASWKHSNEHEYAYVSELWFNPTNGWWITRGYMVGAGRGIQLTGVVYAWMPKPAPAPLPVNESEAK